MNAENNVHLVRHGQTPWTITGQHTGRTDLALTSQGEEDARALAPRLKGLGFDHVFSSPLRRALRTCELAGFAGTATIDRDLLEWDYGHYEGLTLAQIHKERPDWELFRDGCPGGESVLQISERVDRVVSRVRALEGNVLIFSSGHILRVLTARWLGLEPGGGKYFLLSTASLSALAYEHSLSQPVIQLWNDTNHVGS